MTKIFIVIASLLLLTIFPLTNNSQFRHILSTFNEKVEAKESLPQAPKHPMSVKEFVKGQDVFVECVISNFTFSKRDEIKNNKNGSGFLKLYLNGKKVDDIYTAAFIIKGLPVGVHQVKLQLVKNDGTPYGIEHNFEVKIS